MKRIGMMAALALALLAGSAEAQRSTEGRRGSAQSREVLEQRIRAQMGRLMRERLGLSDEQAGQLSEVVSSYDDRRRGLYREEQRVRRRVSELRRDGSADNAAAASLLDAMVSVQLREAELFAEEQAALREVLTPVQVIELQELREEIGRRIRALRGDRDGRNGARRGGRGPGVDTIGGRTR